MTISKYVSIYEEIAKPCSKDEDFDGVCPCAKCLETGEALEEACPDTATAMGGSCKSKLSGSRLSGVCDKGYTWDSKNRKCISLSK